MEINVFPTVGAVTIDFDGEILVITQQSTDGNDPEIIEIPFCLIDPFLAAVTAAVGER